MRLLPFSFAAVLPALSLLAGQVSFEGPEVLKLGWNTRCPRSADFNGDGLPDLAVINQDRSRVEILLQAKGGARPGSPELKSVKDLWNPILELSRFEKRSLVVGTGMFALTTGDWNGDGRADLAYTTDEDKLVLRIHGVDVDDWTQKKEFTLTGASNDSDTLLAADLNGDKLTDLAVITKSQLVVFRQAGGGKWQDALSYSVTAKGCSAIASADLNNDGRTDLFCTPSEGNAVLVRLQDANGGFGEEWKFQISHSKSWVMPVKLGKETGLGWLQNATGMVEVAKLGSAASAADVDMAASVRHAIPPSDTKTGTSAYGDITGDGISDVVIAEPKAARFWVYEGRKDGSFAQGRDYPALSGIEAMAIADADGDQKPELTVLSPAEKTLAIARWTGSRLAYPEPVYQTTDTLIGLSVGAGLKDKGTVIASVRDAKPSAQLLTLKWDAAGKKFAPTQTNLPSPPSKISGLSLIDADQDGRGDVILFSSLSTLQILLSRDDAKVPLKKAEGLPDALTAKLTPTALSQADLDGDGRSELIIAREQLARVISIDKDGKAKVVEQLNAPESGAQLAAAIVKGSKSGKERRVLLVDSSRAEIHELHANDDGVFRPHSRKALGTASWDQVFLLGGAGAEKLLLLGKQGFEVLPLSGATLSLKRLVTFTSELKDASPTSLFAANFSGTGVDDIMLLDSKKSRVAEFFRSEGGDHNSWQSYMYFRVFESDPHYRGKAGFEYEPHDYASLDINGDGKADLCLLAHDRLLLYVQR